MGQPVVHFEIIGKDPEKLRSYYGDLFWWELTRPRLRRKRYRAGQLWIPGPHHLGGWNRHPWWGRRRAEPRCQPDTSAPLRNSFIEQQLQRSGRAIADGKL